MTTLEAMTRIACTSWKRWPIIGLALLALLTLGACSAVRLGYNQGPQLAMWWMDGYLDFDSEQSPRVREALTRWFAWHRRTQLPDYAALLDRVQADMDRPTNAEQVCRWSEAMRSRMEPVVEQSLPMIADLVPTMTGAQIIRLEQRFAKSNEKFRETYLQDDPQARMKAAVERAVERFENVYGRLDDAQRERVAAGVKARPQATQAWYEERLARQAEMLRSLRQLMAERGDRARTLATLRQVAARWEGPRWEAGRPVPAPMLAQCEWIASVHNATTPAQRRKAREKLRGWEQDLRALAAQAAPVVQAEAVTR